MLDENSLGRHYFEIESPSLPPYNRWYGVGKLLIGWVLSLDYQRKTKLLREWPFCFKKGSDLLLPFPMLPLEFSNLKRILDSLGIPLPDKQLIFAQDVLNNCGLRLDLSHSPKIGEKVTVPGLKIPNGFEEPLFPFQEVALRYIQSLGFRAIVGDDMGLGKTPIGIAAALLFRAKRVIIVTRSVALGSWQRAIKNWSDYACHLAIGTKPLKSKRKDGLIKIPEGCITLNNPKPENGIILLNYELLSAWEEALLDYDADIVIFDEVHAVKEPKAARSKTAYKLMTSIEAVIGLTGTPINNKPLELYHILHHVQPGRWGEFFNFVMRYCNAHQKVISKDYKNGTDQIIDGKKVRVPKEKKAWDFSGSRKEKELYKRLRSGLMVRRLKDDVLDLLPPIEETIPIEPSKNYWDVENGELSSIEHLISTDPSEARQGEVSLHHLFAAAALDKIEWVKEWLSAFLEDTDHKIVIFFQYQRVGEALANMLNDWNIQHVNLWGTKPDKDGDLIFQENPDCRVALCSYSMAREAVTLTKASYQLAMEYPWVPGWAEQARDRTRRIGQTKAVTYYYPILVGSAEERIVKALLKKQSIISIITQGEHRKSIGIDDSVLKTKD